MSDKQISPLSKKILESGLVDEHTSALLERWGYLPDGAAALAKDKEGKLREATREQLTKLADEVGEEVEKERKLRETMLDIDKIRWPVKITGIRGRPVNDPHLAEGATKYIGGGIVAVVDRMGRYYFRPRDVKKNWLVPGYTLEHNETGENGHIEVIEETILEVTELSIGEQVAAIQVTVQ